MMTIFCTSKRHSLGIDHLPCSVCILASFLWCVQCSKNPEELIDIKNLTVVLSYFSNDDLAVHNKIRFDGV